MSINFKEMFAPLHEIVDGIWLGNIDSAEDIQFLKSKGIKKILTVMNQVGPNYKDEDGFIHKKIEIIDYDTQNIIQYIGECLKFIKGDDKILVHCMAGASRSASIIIAYIMWTKKMKYDEAYKFVKDKRFMVYPNPGFIKQLKIFEEELIKNEYDIDKIKFNEIKWEPGNNA